MTGLGESAAGEDWPPMITRQQIEEQIAEYFNRRYCFLVGHGSTAIRLALKVIERKVGKGEIILPTVSCTSLAQVTQYAGFKPVFADVNPDDFTLDARSVEARINENTRGILPIHIFGHSAPMDELINLAARRGLFVIEDAAQSLGGSYRGKRHGSLGEFSIFSFGGSKIISAGQGGALATDDEEYAAIIREEMRQLPPFRPSVRTSLKSLSHRNLYHSLVDLLRANPGAEVNHLFFNAIPLYEELYLHSFSGDEQVLERISRGFSQLRENTDLRFERATLYYKLLFGEGKLRHSESWKESQVVWRYTFLVEDPERLLVVTDQLRRNGIHASNHYWSVADLLYGEKNLPGTKYVCPRLLNLWVDEQATRGYIEKSCDIILKNLA